MAENSRIISSALQRVGRSVHANEQRQRISVVPEQQAMEKLWQEHVASEFQSKSAQAALNTMVERPSVNHVPVMTGGVGRKQLTHFYDRYFIPQMPPDTQITPVSRTIGQDRLVDEFVMKFTHSLQMD